MALKEDMKSKSKDMSGQQVKFGSNDAQIKSQYSQSVANRTRFAMEKWLIELKLNTSQMLMITGMNDHPSIGIYYDAQRQSGFLGPSVGHHNH